MRRSSSTARGCGGRARHLPPTALLLLPLWIATLACREPGPRSEIDGADTPRPSLAATPVLSRSGTVFLLDGKPIAPFGLRAANALQSDAATDRLIAALPSMRERGVQSVVVGLQGGRHTEGGNSAFSGFDAEGALVPELRDRLARLLDASAGTHVVAVVNLFYQGRDQELRNDEAVRQAVRTTLEFMAPWRHAWIHMINEPGHAGFDRRILTSPQGHATLHQLAKEIDPGRIVYVSQASGANDGFLADTWNRLPAVTPPTAGNVSIEYERGDSYDTPGVFTSRFREAAMRDAGEAARAGGYWFWHAAWHQKADAGDWPRFDPGGGGTATDPGTAFIWNTMRALGAQP